MNLDNRRVATKRPSHTVASQGVPKTAPTRYDDGAGHPAPVEPRLITLELWIERTYGDAVSIGTARRWCREDRIFPAPEKHGRTYFVQPNARYTDPYAAPRARLSERINGTPTA
jgi:hypothetical protein